MFYVIATVLTIIGIFFLYSAISAFNEIRKGIKKKIQAKPYMVILFSIVAIIFFVLAAASVIYQTTWDQNWNEYWTDTEPIFSSETKLKIYETVEKIEPISLYATFGFGALFSISLLTFKKLSPHLLIISMSFAVITFLSFITIQYTEPSKISQSQDEKSIVETKKEIETETKETNEVDALARDSIERYLKDKNTDVLTLSQFLKEHYKITRNLNDSNIDQLRQYSRGLTEIKKKLVHVEVPRGAEDSMAAGRN